MCSGSEITIEGGSNSEDDFSIGSAVSRYAKIKMTNPAKRIEGKEIYGEYGEFQKLTVNNFSAANGRIDILASNYANIRNLLSGSAGIGDLQNIHLTSDNAVIDTALIRTAVMESVSISDLLAGTISTNKFKIMSDDGGIQISGATQQWKDINGVIRMQAGRDAQGNFTFALFDETGKGTLIDSTGVQPGAIADGLIVNEMVSDTANIAASKLDIDSLFTVINDSTQVIKSNRIWLDDSGQSLNQAYTKMTQDITDIGEEASEAKETAGRTETKVTEIKFGIDGMSTKMSEISTDLEGVTDGTLLFNVKYEDNGDDTTTVTAVLYKCIIRILIEGGKTFGLTKVSGYSFVDNENTLVTATTAIDSLITHTVSAPSEAKFIWVQVEGEHLNQAQVEYGSPTEYMEYDNFSSIMVGNKEILPVPFISEKPSDKSAYSSRKTDEKIQEEIGKIKLLYTINNKNLVNPEFYLGEYRLYVNKVGNKQTYTSKSGKAAYRLPAEENKTYTFTNIEIVGFVDSNDVLIEDSKESNGVGVSIFPSPIGTKFMFVSSEATRNLQIEIGNKSTMYEPFESDKYIALKGDKYICTDDLPVISKMDLTTVVNPQMTKNEFIDAINSKIAEYAELCKCSTRSFNEIIKGNGYNNDWDFIFKTVNHNLRKDIAVGGKSFEMICSDINKAFKERILRFCDAKLETGNSRDFSLNTGFQADEPSAIVSEDGSTLYIYAHLKRISTTDGVNWTEPINTTLTGATDENYIMHNNVNLIDGTYYMIGATKNTGGNLVLYTSTDGINFTYDGILFKSGETFGGSYATESFGNTYLIKEYGSDKFYLYVEYQSSSTSWIISVAICDDIFHVNSDGTIGNWTFANSNPIIISPNNDYSRNDSSAGNPDFAKGMDNRPIKVDGKYYMYFHSTIDGIAHIMRAKSSDLINWEIEGIILDNRDVPTGGDNTSGNADACMIEFNGRTYLFYSWDINNSSVKPYIKYMIDDRPLHELLKLRP